MIFQTLKVLIHINFRIFFRKIFLTNKKVISKNRATILALNHPTAFLDPMLICTYIRPSTSFLLRGDLFKKPLVIWFLRQIRTIPIFRFRDGFSSLKRNQSSFDYCYELLHKKGHIIVLAEGNTVHEKRLRPIQKGTARMAFGVFEKYGDTDIDIIPVGVNYTDSVRFRSEVMAEVGKPIHLQDYMAAYKENPRKAVRQITVEIQNQLNDLVVHIDKDEDIEMTDRLLLIHRNNLIKTILPRVSDDNTLLHQEVQIARQVNEMEQEEKAPLAIKVNEYFNQLKKHQLTDLGLSQNFHFNLKNTLILLIGLIPFLWGYLTSFIPLSIGKKVADSKVKRLEFHSSVRFGVCLVLYSLLFLILLISSLIIGHKIFIGLIILMPFCGHLAVLYQDVFYNWNEARKAKNIEKDLLEKLVLSREKLLNAVKPNNSI